MAAGCFDSLSQLENQIISLYKQNHSFSVCMCALSVMTVKLTKTQRRRQVFFPFVSANTAKD